MPNLSKKLFLIFAVIMFFMVFFKFFSLISFPDTENALEKGEPFKLQPSYSLTQKFIANRNNLMKIEFLLRTPGPKSGDVVQMEINDETCSENIRSGVLKKSFLSSDNLYEFKFSKIPESDGKILCLKTTLKPGLADSKFIRFFLKENQDPQFTLTDISSNKKIEGQSLSMRLAYKNESVWQDISELNQRISQYKPWFLKHYYLGTIIILFTLLSFAIVVILIEL